MSFLNTISRLLFSTTDFVITPEYSKIQKSATSIENASIF